MTLEELRTLVEEDRRLLEEIGEHL